MHTVSFGINYWSKGTIKPLFLRHEGYLGAIGAFMQSARFEHSNLWGENFASSSGYREKTLSDEGRFLSIHRIYHNRCHN